MKKRGLLTLTMVFVGTLSVFAQSGAAASKAPPPAAEGFNPQFLTLELGLPLGYSLADGSLIAGRAFALSIAIADKFSVGIATTQVGTVAPLTNYKLFTLSYGIIPLLGTTLSIGQAGANVGAGLGFYSTLLETKSLNGLSTALRLKIDYLFDTGNVAAGSIVFTTGIVFGI